MKKKKKSKANILTFILMAVLIVLIVYLIQKNNKPKIIFSNDLKVEINEEVKILDFVTSINKGQIITENKQVDTTKLGENIFNSIKEKAGKATEQAGKTVKQSGNRGIKGAKEKKKKGE